MPPRTRNGHDGEPPALEAPDRMSVAALQSELQRLGYEFRTDSAGRRLRKADLVERLTAARILGAPAGPAATAPRARKRARRDSDDDEAAAADAVGRAETDDVRVVETPPPRAAVAAATTMVMTPEALGEFQRGIQQQGIQLLREMRAEQAADAARREEREQSERDIEAIRGAECRVRPAGPLPLPPSPALPLHSCGARARPTPLLRAAARRTFRFGWSMSEVGWTLHAGCFDVAPPKPERANAQYTLRTHPSARCTLLSPTLPTARRRGSARVSIACCRDFGAFEAKRWRGAVQHGGDTGVRGGAGVRGGEMVSV